jgi:hypothetical protein
VISFDHNINLLKPEQRVRERTKDARHDPFIDYDRWDFLFAVIL